MGNSRVLQKATKELTKAKAPKTSKDIIYDPAGYWNPNNQGQPVRVPSPIITMQGVPYPVLAQPNVGQPQIMYPGQDYVFPGADYVDEQPQMKKGGRPRGLISMPKPSKKGLASKAYSRSLDATNRLFTENNLFKKPKDKRRKVFDPNAKYYKDGGNTNCPEGYVKDENGVCVKAQTHKEVVVKAKRIDPTIKKLNRLREKLEYYDSQNNGLGPTSMSDMTKRADIFKDIAELEVKHKKKLRNTPRVNQANAVGNIMLTAGKYFMPKQVQTGVDYLLNATDAHEYLQDHNSQDNQKAIASDILSPLKSKRSKLSPFSVASDVINLKQQFNKFQNAKNQEYQDGGEADYNVPTNYQDALRNFIYPEIINLPEETDTQKYGYDAALGVINQNPNDPIINMSNPWWGQHELYHHLQNQAGALSTYGAVGQRPNPYVASDESIGSYYDRRNSEFNTELNKIFEENPDISEEEAYGLAEENLYKNPTSVEGEARNYEGYIDAGNIPIFSKKQNGGEYGMPLGTGVSQNFIGNRDEFKVGGIPELPLRDNQVNYDAYVNRFEPKTRLYEDGGIIAELTDEEIQAYRDGGYVVEDISIPSLNQKQLGGAAIIGEEYVYKKRPGSVYKVNDRGEWQIKNKSTKGKYVTINDPEGTRSEELDRKAIPLFEQQQEEKKRVKKLTEEINKPKEFIDIADTRTIRATTGEKINPNVDLKAGKYNKTAINKIVKKAKKVGVDPATMIAIALQESNIGKTDSNLGHSQYGDPNYPYAYIDFYKKKLDEAKRAKINDELMQIQYYNGLGVITPKTEKNYHGFEMQKIYGVPIPASGISMRKNPLYGKQIKDLRDNVILKNAYIQGLLKQKQKGGVVSELPKKKINELVAQGYIVEEVD